MSDDDSLPSLGLVTAEVDRLVAEQERRAERYDTIAGLLVAFCAALIGLSDDPSLFGAAAALACMASTAASMASLVVRVSLRPSPRSLRRYGEQPRSWTGTRLLDLKIWVYERDEALLAQKAARLRVALSCVAIGVGFSLTGTFELALR
ncbi:MAG TPA: hypothetical protein PLZ93_25940 [Nocardioides sp.]|uniref:hypothetical protein n=1 Tax=uncultured Nocardioides sp. TaxID=198441 RepID=UPI000EE2C751|nr:hypothetical protein [uncultured Nocardioides sp.]HCB07006.1 hypothetical protein [Nocardioides sp.]HRI99092.1 hypothetical protein [Nocardioides sp.]HRK47163.1 hypothetical protein [Nocardioides sp.]